MATNFDIPEVLESKASSSQCLGLDEVIFNRLELFPRIPNLFVRVSFVAPVPSSLISS